MLLLSTVAVLVCPPALPEGVANTAVVGITHGLIVMGGDDMRASSNAVWLYERGAPAWIALPPMRQSRLGAFAARFGERIWVFGGIERSLTTERVLDSVESFDLQGEHWRNEPPMPMPLAHFGAVVVGTTIYFFGGATAKEDTSTTALRFDAATGAWTTLTELPYPTNRIGAFVVGKSIFVAGGQSKDGSAIRTVLELERDRWRIRPSLQTARKNFATLTVGALAIAIGGWSEHDGKPVFFSDSEVLRAGAWVKGPSIHFGRDGARAVLVDGEIAIVGGYRGEFLPSIECFRL